MATASAFLRRRRRTSARHFATPLVRPRQRGQGGLGVASVLRSPWHWRWSARCGDRARRPLQAGNQDPMLDDDDDEDDADSGIEARRTSSTAVRSTRPTTEERFSRPRGCVDYPAAACAGARRPRAARAARRRHRAAFGRALGRAEMAGGRARACVPRAARSVAVPRRRPFRTALLLRRARRGASQGPPAPPTSGRGPRRAGGARGREGDCQTTPSWPNGRGAPAGEVALANGCRSELRSRRGRVGVGAGRVTNARSSPSRRPPPCWHFRRPSASRPSRRLARSSLRVQAGLRPRPAARGQGRRVAQRREPRRRSPSGAVTSSARGR